MSYKNIAPTSTAPDTNANKVRPTLLIGVGGTGGNVLQRVRNWIVDQYGSLDNFPILRFLHMDTDERATKDSSKDIRKDPLFKKKEFVDSEWISLKVNVAQFLEVSNFPRLKPWFKPDQRLRDRGDLGQGAGQVRVASRLGFFHHYGQNKIRPKLESLLRQLRSIDLNKLTHPDLKNLQLYTNTINVFVICSSAGGTGSGAFLDIGALLHTISGIETHLVLVLPEVFKDQDPRCVANGYAALVELNHYQYANNFTIYFEQEPRTVPPPLYQNTYLIDGRSISGGTTVDTGLYSMIANSLIQDFKSGQFSDDKRSFRSNMAQYTGRLAVYEHQAPYNNRPLLTETFPCRYSSFGMSRIYYPREQIVKSCSYRLGAQIMNYWLGGSDRANVTDQVLTFLKDCKLTYEDIRRYLETKDQATLDNIFRVKIDQKIENCRELSDGWSRELRHFNETFIHDHLREDDPKDPARWGDFLRHIRQTCFENTLQMAHNAMLKLLKERLSHPSYGFDYVLQILGATPAILRGSHYREKALQAMTSEEKRLQYFQRQYQDAIRQLQDLEGWSGFQKLVGGWKEAVDVQIKEWNEGTFGYLRARGYKYVYETYLNLLEKIAALVETDLMLELTMVNTIVVEKKQEFQALSDYYRHKDESSKMDLRLYHPDELEQYYKKVLVEDDAVNVAVGGAKPPLRLSDYAGQLLSHLQEIGILDTPTVSALTDKIKGDVGSNRVIDAMVEFLEREVSDRIKVHILDLLFPPNYVETIIRKNVEDNFNLAKGWVHINDSVPPELQLPQGGHKMLIGVDSSHPYYGKLRTMIESFHSGTMSIDFKPIGNSHEIVFYGEMSGFALAAMSCLQEMRRAFREKERDPSQIDLFTTKNHFMMRDILYRDDEGRKRYLRSVKAFVLGLAAGIIQQNENIDQNEPRNRIYTVIQYDERDQRQIKPIRSTLGMFEKAINTLFEENSAVPMREKILKDVERFKARLMEVTLPEQNDQYKGHLLLWYSLLDRLLSDSDQPFPEIEVELPGGRREKMISPERESIVEEMYDVSLLIPVIANKEQFSKSMSLLKSPHVQSLFTVSWVDEIRDSPQDAIHFSAFDEKVWEANRALLSDIIRGKDPHFEARRIFHLALLYGKLNKQLHADIISHRNVSYSFKRALDKMGTRFADENIGTYEESIDKLSRSVELRQILEGMVKHAEEELAQIANGRGRMMAWLVIEVFMESGVAIETEVYQERIDNLQSYLKMAFPGRREELLKVREALLKHISDYTQEVIDEPIQDNYPTLRCRALDWEKINSARAQLTSLLQTGEVVETPAVVPQPVQRRSTDALESYRDRVRLMLRAGKGQIGPAQKRALDHSQAEFGLSNEQAQAIIAELTGTGSKKAHYDYAVFFLGFYDDGTADIQEFRKDLDAEAVRLRLSQQEAARVEKQVTDYIDFYRAMVSDGVVENWIREELKKEQQELGLSDELVELIEGHIKDSADKSTGGGTI